MKPNHVICILLAALFPFAMTGCAHSQGSETVNEIRLSLAGISNVTISYDDEPVTFYLTEGSDLLIKEYMTKSSVGYYAHVKRNDGSIHISEGGKPLFKSGFYRRIEVYLPASYSESLTVTTTDGDIDFTNAELQLSQLRIDSTAGTVDVGAACTSGIYLSTTSGTLRLGSLKAGHIRLETTSGTVSCDKLAGTVEYTSTSGDLEVKAAAGSGSYRANNSGTLQVSYTEVTGDLYFFNKNDDITLTLPQNLSFEFEAMTKNGSVATTFQEYLTVDGRTTCGAVGGDPSVSVKAETNNGTITVTQ